ncbi:hypothetical protein PRO82_000181 [Candidatus Protochlamydia amoebophila]|nr:hypothetical protein [Candidatus Protochlamydia amoebophila]
MKIDRDQLKNYIKNILKEIAKEFNVDPSSIFYACNRLKITLKRPYFTKKKKNREEFKLGKIEKEDCAYIDESKINECLERHNM